jgi:hypothetical protein
MESPCAEEKFFWWSEDAGRSSAGDLGRIIDMAAYQRCAKTAYCANGTDVNNSR